MVFWYISPFIVRLTRNLPWRSRITLDTKRKWFNRYIWVEDHSISMRFDVLTQILVLKTVTWQSIKICIFKMAGGAVLKIVYGYISTIYCAINAKFVRGSTIMFDTGRLAKYQILHGGRPPFWRWFYWYILAADHLVSMKFDADANINTNKTRHVTKFQILQPPNEKRGIVSFSVYMKNGNKGASGCIHKLFRSISSPVEITSSASRGCDNHC